MEWTVWNGMELKGFSGRKTRKESEQGGKMEPGAHPAEDAAAGHPRATHHAIDEHQVSFRWCASPAGQRHRLRPTVRSAGEIGGRPGGEPLSGLQRPSGTTPTTMPGAGRCGEHPMSLTRDPKEFATLAAGGAPLRRRGEIPREDLYARQGQFNDAYARAARYRGGGARGPFQPCACRCRRRPGPVPGGVLRVPAAAPSHTSGPSNVSAGPA